MHRSLIRFLRRAIQFCARVHLPCTRKRITMENIQSILEIIQDGDVVFTHTRGEFSNFGLSYWSHAGIFNQGKFFEATTHGVSQTDPIYFLAKKDAVLIYRPKFQFCLKKMVNFLTSNLNKPYDFGFEDSDREFYCFELAARTFAYSSKIALKKVTTIIGKKYLFSSFDYEHFQFIKEIR